MPSQENTHSEPSRSSSASGKGSVAFKPPAQFKEEKKTEELQFAPAENSEAPFRNSSSAKPVLQQKSGEYGAKVVQRALWQFHGDSKWVRVTDAVGLPQHPFPKDVRLGYYFDDQNGLTGGVRDGDVISPREQKEPQLERDYREVHFEGAPVMLLGLGPAIDPSEVKADVPPEPKKKFKVPGMKDPFVMEEASDWSWEQIKAWQAWYRDLDKSGVIYQHHRKKLIDANQELIALSMTPDVAKEKAADEKAAAEAKHAEDMKNNPEYKANYEFQEAVKDKRRVVNPEKVARAKQIADKFRKTDAPMQFDLHKKENQGNKNFIAGYLDTVAENPEKLDQAGYPLCGPDTFLRVIALHEPELYVQYVSDLLISGTGKLGRMTITIPDNIREKRVWAKTMKMPELVASGSLRSQKNKIYSNIRTDKNKFFAKQWHAGISGMTTMGELTGWFTEMGLPAEAIESNSYYITDATAATVATINQEFNKGKAVALVVNPAVVGNVLNNAISSAILYRHWVTLTTPIVQTSDKTHYMAEIMTYGATKKMLFLARQLGKALLGYVTIDMSRLAAGGEKEK